MMVLTCAVSVLIVGVTHMQRLAWPQPCAQIESWRCLPAVGGNTNSSASWLRQEILTVVVGVLLFALLLMLLYGAFVAHWPPVQ
mmetsp:Transcript_103500/g.331854  ORF Transcript_103500/g.331854 Transcript_103500/m.331854 type:complete len:84 (+) Transcript_103500:69-320(+)